MASSRYVHKHENIDTEQHHQMADIFDNQWYVVLCFHLDCLELQPIGRSKCVGKEETLELLLTRIVVVVSGHNTIDYHDNHLEEQCDDHVFCKLIVTEDVLDGRRIFLIFQLDHVI